ncbi:MAG: tetratricopeptide repeat protein [Planctomycetota bacterium]
MALQKDPSRRYSTVQQFREDIDRYLAGLPVIARKDTAGYRIAKFVRRHRPAVIGVTAVIAALAVGVMGTLLGLREARAERDVAYRVSTFMQDVLVSANPYHNGGETNVLDVLSDASRRVSRELRDQPEAAAAARYAIAEVYSGLWRWPEVEPQVRMALDSYRELYGDDHPAVAKCLTLLGRALTFRACQESVGIQREGLAIRTKTYGERHPLVAESKTCLAFAYWAASEEPRWTAAEKLYKEALHIFRVTNTTQDRRYARALFSLGAMYLAKGDANAETEALLAESLTVFRSFAKQGDRYMSECLRAFADLHRLHGRDQEEAAALEESLTITPRIFLSDDRVRKSAWRRAVLAAKMNNLSDYHRCLQRAMHAECSRREQFPKIHGAAWSEFSGDLPKMNSLPALVRSIDEQLGRLPMKPCEWNLELAERLSRHSPYLANQVDHDLAHRLARRCLDYQLTRFPYRKLPIATMRVQYGRSLIVAGRYEEAEEQLLTAYKTIHPQVRNTDARHVGVVRALVRLYEAAGDPEKAGAIRPKLPAAQYE